MYVHVKSMHLDDDTVLLESNDDVSRRLRTRTHVLSTVCGYETHSYVLHAVRLLQRRLRAWSWKMQRAAREASFRVMARRYRMHHAREHRRLCRDATIRMQSFVRGRCVRRSLAGRAVARIVEYEHEKLLYEITLLRWSNIRHRIVHTPHNLTTQSAHTFT